MIKLFVKSQQHLQRNVVYPLVIADLDRAYSGEMSSIANIITFCFCLVALLNFWFP